MVPEHRDGLGIFRQTTGLHFPVETACGKLSYNLRPSADPSRRIFKANHPEVVCALRFLDPSVRREMDILLPEDVPGLDLRSPFLSNVGVIPSSVGSFGDEITVSAVWIVTDFVSGRYPSLVFLRYGS